MQPVKGRLTVLVGLQRRASIILSSIPSPRDIAKRGLAQSRALYTWVGIAVAVALIFNAMSWVLFSSPGLEILQDKLIKLIPPARQVSLDCGQRCRRRLLILQTSDGDSQYSRMLDALQGVQIAYANYWGYSYLRWDGVARGTELWLATYNRIYLLYELWRKGQYDWVLYMDPDAVFVDPALSVEQLLDDKYAVVACRGGEIREWHWDVNIGVIFFNMKHRDFGYIIKNWMWRVKKIPANELKKFRTKDYVRMEGGPPIPDDQQMFHELVKKHRRHREFIKRYFDAEDLSFNYQDGTVIKHLIRANNKDQGARVADLGKIASGFFEKLAALEGTGPGKVAGDGEGNGDIDGSSR